MNFMEIFKTLFPTMESLIVPIALLFLLIVIPTWICISGVVKRNKVRSELANLSRDKAETDRELISYKNAKFDLEEAIADYKVLVKRLEEEVTIIKKKNETLENDILYKESQLDILNRVQEENFSRFQRLNQHVETTIASIEKKYAEMETQNIALKLENNAFIAILKKARKKDLFIDTEATDTITEFMTVFKNEMEALKAGNEQLVGLLTTIDNGGDITILNEEGNTDVE